MSEHTTPPGNSSGESGQPKTDTQRLRAVEVAVQSLVPRVAKLEERTTETRRSLEILKVMVTTVLDKQEEIRDSLGVMSATRDAVVVIMEKLDMLDRKIDKLPCRDEGEKANA